MWTIVVSSLELGWAGRFGITRNHWIKSLRERNKFETAYRLTKNKAKKKNIKRCNLGKKVWDGKN